MPRIVRLFLHLLAGLAALSLLLVGGFLAAYIALAPGLPSVEEVRNVELQVPLRVHAADGTLMAEFGEMRRTPIRFDQVPVSLRQAFIAAEDQRFYQHPGVDYQGLVRAVWYLVRTGEKGPGGSTITMQLARNLFLTRERTYLRKVREIMLALRIERELDKETIFELYLNKIYLGQRAYGVAAAARVYYDKPLADLTLAEQAMIAGLPKAPSAANPITNSERGLQRRGYVLGRMLDSGFIDEPAYLRAMAEPVTAQRHLRRPEFSAPYVAEMARQWVVERYGADQAYTAGFEVYTTVDVTQQKAAQEALVRGLHAYDERHGYRGAIEQLAVDTLNSAELIEALSEIRTAGALRAAVVTEIAENGAQLLTAQGDELELPWTGVAWASTQPAELLSPGDVIYFRETTSGYRLAQLPQAQGAIAALDPVDGRVLGLAGGYSFSLSSFNRATQARRQPGSAFKPLIYSAALEHGITPATIINDAPVVFSDVSLEGVWRPENYSGQVFGPTRLREALIHSRNLVSIRVLRQIGLPAALEHIQKLGLSTEQMSPTLSLALGAAEVTPMELAASYAPFANGGLRVKPWFIERVTTKDRELLFGVRLERGISAGNAWLMRSMLEDVVREGTGRSALRLGREDLAGKTGTTNDQNDAWFAGFNGDVVATAWVGFDELQSLGRYETGGRAALPIWIDFMEQALEGKPNTNWVRPPGVVTLRIDAETGERTSPENPNARFETFLEGSLPPQGDVARRETEGSDAEPIF
ncbi:PBP1A family penicillin-binding protein [Spiribacter sp. C176]|uniref:Penicillin-binding protein 1A n=1 Tax=Spiribacter salilacus TaxID=2664894 RepID=A0A6N7QUR5_9GAMM|nr:penicillin-binding protein 1A [Spiribacter salilacus]MRH78067.1 PBP1A family penicillin-binding protein [Spiribacter salilacus]